jgi:hypothetical protein
MGETRGTYRCWWGNMKEKDNLEVLSVDGKTILKLFSINLLGGRGVH